MYIQHDIIMMPSSLQVEDSESDDGQHDMDSDDVCVFMLLWLLTPYCKCKNIGSTFNLVIWRLITKSSN